MNTQAKQEKVVDIEMDRRSMLRLGVGVLLSASLPREQLVAQENSPVQKTTVVDCLISTLDQKSMAGKVHSIKDGSVFFSRNGVEQTLDIASVLEISVVEPTKIETTAEILTLTNGNRLPLKSVLYKQSAFTLNALEENTQIEISGKKPGISSVQFIDLPESARKSWSNLEKSKSITLDRLVLLNTEKGSIDWLEGYISAISRDSITFFYEENSYEVKRNRPNKKIAGVFFGNPSKEKQPEATGKLLTASGATLTFTELNMDKGQLHVKGLHGVNVSLPLLAVARIDLSNDKVFSVDSLRVQSIDFLDTKSQPFERRLRPAINQSALGGPLRLGDNTFGKGLSLQGGSEITFRLPREAGNFRGIVGIDPSTQGDAKSTLHIIGIDGLKETQLAQLELSARAEPSSIDTEITGFRSLKLVVDPGSDLLFGDIVNIANASVWASPKKDGSKNGS